LSKYYNQRRFADERGRSVRGGLVVFLFLFAAFASVIFASLLLSNDNSRLKLMLLRLGFQQSSFAPLLAPLSTVESGRHTAPDAPASSPKRGRLAVTHAPIRADDQCASLAAIANVTPVFNQEDGGAKWECSYLVTDPDERLQSSIFVQIRGREAGGNATFRLKISFGNAHERGALAYKAAAIAARLLYLDESLMISLGDALAGGQNFRREIAASTISYKREMLDENRYNLVGTYPLAKLPIQDIAN
jgi:hypothetical protein